MIDVRAKGWIGWLEDKRQEVERLLVTINYHGPSVMLEPHNFALYRWARKYAPEAARWIEDEMDDAPHANGCACWSCVLRLQAEVTMHTARLRVQLMAAEEFD